MRLIWNAVPTIFDVPNPPPKLAVKRPLPNRTVETQSKRRCKRKITTKDSTSSASSAAAPLFEATETHLAPSSLDPSTVETRKTASPAKRALRLKLKTLRQKWRRHKKKGYFASPTAIKSKESLETKKRHLLEELKDFLPPATMAFVATQIRMSGRKKRGNRWSLSEKAMALSLLHTSPKAYRMLQKILNLPSIQTLRRTMQRIKIFPGFNENIMKALKQKVSSMQPEARACSVVFDEMTIKEALSYNVEEDYIEGLEDFGNQRTHHAANHATVLMARGLLVSWKQALGYFLSSGPINGNLLKSLLSQCLQKLTELGLDVKALICDQGSNNRKALESLGVKTDKSYFLHEGRKVYVFYDPPHLLKNVRNNLKKTGFVVDNKNIEWNYIEEFYRLDSKNAVRMAPKLSERHIRLPGFSAQNVKLATQVLSHSVAAGVSTMVTLGALPSEAKETALFVERLDQLFNAFNSSRKHSNQKMLHAFSENSGHKAFLQGTLSWLSTLESKSSRSLPCLSGWKISIQSLLLLWEDLHNVYGIKFLYTSKLNQDCIENLFSMIRGKGGHGDNPNPRQFRLFLRQLMVDSILLQSPSSNCVEDGDNFLLTLNSMQIERQYSTPVQNNPDVDGYIVHSDTALMSLLSSTPTEDLNIAEENILTYIAGYIARKIKGKVCNDCKEVLVGQLEGIHKETLLMKKQLPDLAGDGLVVPSRQLVNAVEKMEVLFKKSEQLLHMDRVRERFLERLKKEGSCLLCPSGTCKLSFLVVTLFVNIRLHFTLKDNNRRFAAASGRKNRKLLKIHHV